MGKTIISYGDLLDVYRKTGRMGRRRLLGLLNPGDDARVAAKWNEAQPESDFWVIPEIRKHWNELISDNPDEGYEAYVVRKYLQGKSGLKMLSVGCGTGSHERNFARFPQIAEITGTDIAPGQIASAQKTAAREGWTHIRYICGDFTKQQFSDSPFDLVLFHASLHHFKDIEGFLINYVKPLLHPDGLLIVHEYCGPNRLQWTKSQLQVANRLLIEIPAKFRTLPGSTAVKSRIYRPGLLRMWLTDPSEAVDSESMIPALHRHFRILEEKKLGWNITHILFKDISHHFAKDDPEAASIVQQMIQKESEFVEETGESDAIFGVYSHKKP